MKTYTGTMAGSLVAIGLLLFTGAALANDVYMGDFAGRYPASGIKNSCSVCHTSPPSLNPYGSDFLGHGFSLAAIEGFDSDGDTYSNLAEIQAGTFPGNPASHPTPPATPQVTVLTPNGGEVIPSGSGYAITWNAVPAATSFKLAYTLTGGAPWSKIAAGVTGTSYVWPVPSPLKNSTRALVRVTAFGAAGKLGKDISDKAFTVEVVRVKNPKAADTLVMNSPVLIEWTVNDTARPNPSVNVLFSPDGLSWAPIAGSPFAPGTLSADWTVPILPAATSKARLKVVLSDAGGKLGKYATGAFSIVP
jgi:hypothetical protein